MDWSNINFPDENHDFYTEDYLSLSDIEKKELHKKLGCTDEFANAILEENEDYVLSWHDRIVFQAHEPRRFYFGAEKCYWFKVKPIPLTKIKVLEWQDPHQYFFEYSDKELHGAKYKVQWHRREEEGYPCALTKKEKFLVKLKQKRSVS
jgi:hypothetical protein